MYGGQRSLRVNLFIENAERNCSLGSGKLSMATDTLIK